MGLSRSFSISAKKSSSYRYGHSKASTNSVTSAITTRISKLHPKHFLSFIYLSISLVLFSTSPPLSRYSLKAFLVSFYFFSCLLMSCDTRLTEDNMLEIYSSWSLKLIFRDIIFSQFPLVTLVTEFLLIYHRIPSITSKMQSHHIRPIFNCNLTSKLSLSIKNNINTFTAIFFLSYSIPTTLHTQFPQHFLLNFHNTSYSGPGSLSPSAPFPLESPKPSGTLASSFSRSPL